MLDNERYAEGYPDVWGTFDFERKRLERQFENVEYIEDTGCSIEELNKMVRDYLDSTDDSRVIQKAVIYRMIVTNGRITVDPKDWFADKLNHGNIIRNICENWQHEVEEFYLPVQTELMHKADETGYYNASLDLGHVSPGWTFLLQEGLSGLLKKAKQYREGFGDAITNEQKDFYNAIEIVYTSTIELAHRLSSLAADLIANHPDFAPRLEVISDALKNVPENPPTNFHQALQFIYIVHQMIEMEGQWVRSMGGFDRLLYPYYKADIESGVLARAQAKELIKFFWTKFFAHTRGVANGKNFYFGGQDSDGEDAVNDLTYVALEAYEELKTTDPKLSVRFFKKTSDQFLYQIAKMIRNGQTTFVLTNDEVAVPAMVKRGKTLEEARSHLLIGCYEPAVEGREVACNMSIKINLAKGIELALNNGIDPGDGTRLGPETGELSSFCSYEDFQDAYLAQMDYQVSQAMECIKHLELYWPDINPSPFLAGTFVDCLKSGKDIGQGGPKYNNTGCMGAGLANAADSLLAIKQLVYEEQKYNISEFNDILTNNYNDDELLRQYILHRLPKWGNNLDAVDDIALHISKFYTNKVNHSRNNRGGWFQASMFTLDHRYAFGKATGALPDGRKAGVYLAPSINAMTGNDKNGITGLINSVTKLDFSNIPNGSVMDISLHPTAVKGKDGLNALISLIRTYFQKGGFAVQFNIFDTNMLREAQRNPQKYATLQIRVTGWNVYFISLSEQAQNQFINENKHVL